jgi:hypothetical protein
MQLPPFYIGQKVVYITGKDMPKDSIHTVREIIKTTCGCHWIDIGRTFSNMSYPPTVKCFSCGNMIIRDNDNNIKWYHTTSFRPLQELKFPLMTFSRVIEKELVSAN